MKTGIRILLLLSMLEMFAWPAMAASTFEIKTVIGDPGTIWGTLDAGTQALIVFITGTGMLAAIVAAVLSYEAHSIKGSVGEQMDVQGARQTAYHGMLKTTFYFLGMLFFIGLIGLIFKLYG
jgi:hypothetical protein